MENEAVIKVDSYKNWLINILFRPALFIDDKKDSIFSKITSHVYLIEHTVGRQAKRM